MGALTRLNKQQPVATLLCLISILQVANAADIRWGGHLNATGAFSDSPVPYLDAEIDNRGSFGDTTFGINMGMDLDDKLSIAAQLATHPSHNNIELDWGFASYRLDDSISISAGQLKYPGNLVSEYVDVGYLYPWIRPPQEIYSHTEVSAAMTLESFKGARILYTGRTKHIDYDLQLYAGAAEEETMNHDKMLGAVINASIGNTRLLFGFNRANMEMLSYPSAPMNGKYMTVLSVGMTSEWENAFIYTEFVHSSTEGISLLDTHGGYITVGYTFDKLQPHITYSFLNQNTDAGQETVTIGVRREITPSSALKLEWQRVHPQEASTTGINAVPMIAGQAGLFRGVPDNDYVDIVSVSMNVYF